MDHCGSNRSPGSTGEFVLARPEPNGLPGAGTLNLEISVSRETAKNFGRLVVAILHELAHVIRNHKMIDVLFSNPDRPYPTAMVEVSAYEMTLGILNQIGQMEAVRAANPVQQGGRGAVGAAPDRKSSAPEAPGGYRAVRPLPAG